MLFHGKEKSYLGSISGQHLSLKPWDTEGQDKGTWSPCPAYLRGDAESQAVSQDVLCAVSYTQ